MPINAEAFKTALKTADFISVNGNVQNVIGLIIGSSGPPKVSIGEICRIRKRENQNYLAEVVGFTKDAVLLMPLGESDGISPGSEVIATGSSLRIPASQRLLGRVLNGLGQPMDEKGEIESTMHIPVISGISNPLTRKRIEQPLSVGIRAIDGLLTIGKGQRIGIFAGSGVGKSTVLGMMARYTSADINVIALIGERGREVREFIERDLGEKALKKSVVIVATSDQPALIRIKGAMVATTIAEYFRDQGRDVLLMMDSITRFAMAQREIGLAIGEPPAMKGYTPSVFAMLPKLLERAGTSKNGSITGLYTVLVDADDFNEPISDAARSILDGHIMLSRQLASLNHYPAIDVLHSVSRVMPDVTTNEHRASAGKLREVLATYREAEDLINIGAYIDGSNPRIDYAKRMIDPVNAFLRQSVEDPSKYKLTLEQLTALFGADL